MGTRPSVHEELLQDQSIKEQGRHNVLVDNFLNAQCMIDPCKRPPRAPMLTRIDSL